MVYAFACPAPCSRVIKVDASDDDDAVNKIMEAGAINCRNINSTPSCKKVLQLPPLPEENLRAIVLLCMSVEN